MGYYITQEDVDKKIDWLEELIDRHTNTIVALHEGLEVSPNNDTTIAIQKAVSSYRCEVDEYKNILNNWYIIKNRILDGESITT